MLIHFSELNNKLVPTIFEVMASGTLMGLGGIDQHGLPFRVMCCHYCWKTTETRL